jgi:hypothetical protein
MKRADGEHTTVIEYSSKGCFYAWCTNPDCFWQSPYRKAEDAVQLYAIKHEDPMPRISRRLRRGARV